MQWFSRCFGNTACRILFGFSTEAEHPLYSGGRGLRCTPRTPGRFRLFNQSLPFYRYHHLLSLRTKELVGTPIAVAIHWHLWTSVDVILSPTFFTRGTPLPRTPKAPQALSGRREGPTIAADTRGTARMVSPLKNVGGEAGGEGSGLKENIFNHFTPFSVLLF